MEADPVVVVDYDRDWPQRFDAERDRLVGALAELAVAVEHIGSTSVQGLASKPVLDVMVAVPSRTDLSEAVRGAERLGYRRDPECDFSGRLFLRLPAAGAASVHLSLTTMDSDYWASHLLFRDRLRADPALAAEYVALKRRLAAEHPRDRMAYVKGKSEFVARVCGAGWVD
jgi:GrpB-like predicted nucleotidyltransferase (UPF0157 family)